METAEVVVSQFMRGTSVAEHAHRVDANTADMKRAVALDVVDGLGGRVKRCRAAGSTTGQSDISRGGPLDALQLVQKSASQETL